MNKSATVDPNPLVRLARLLPARIGGIAALVARLAGGALAIAIAVEQSYDGTRIIAATIAALVWLSCLPFPARLRNWFTWLGAGILFFGGALLIHIPAGVLMLLCGAVAAIGEAIDEQQHERRNSVLMFFVGFAVTMTLVVVIVLGIEG